MTSSYNFPFGQPVKPCQPRITKRRELYILGAYPSAFHVIWNPPAPFRKVRAIAVDNEPEIFWNGDKEEIYFKAWKDAVNFSDDWGFVAPATRLNGTSGKWVDENVIERFNLKRGNVWLSDCLDTYRCSSGLWTRIQDTYLKLPQPLHIPKQKLLQHPSEGMIVKEALENQIARIRGEIESAKPDKLVTLGNAALRVLSQIFQINNVGSSKLSANQKFYGKPIFLRLASGHTIQWFPLAHPAAPRPYQQVHQHWRPL